jgi:flavin reductase (DIM6/NTAB) family NADH-FMN oxidoreductase RutF
LKYSARTGTVRAAHFGARSLIAEEFNMFYRTDQHHGLPHDPLKSCIVPRPIGWLTTLDGEGRLNLAPFSFFNGIASDPPLVIAGVNGAPPPAGMKDTLANCRATGEFVVNIATWDLRDAMNLTSAAVPAAVDEMALAGLTPAPSELVAPPRVAESPIHMECKVHDIQDMPCTAPGSRNTLIIGQIVGIHIDDWVLTDGLIDMAKVRPIARLGYMDYTVVEEVFTMHRPSAEQALEGAAE